ncbi:MAG: type II toxin-antitoxin system PemK/MazF family toxin [Planctomycetes bacterium]|nr:type II toxin-antitoxin system PemK/MazF family toxin [Planctomycetota bacterium]
MGRFVKGDIVVARFPFSDLTASKRRPALVVAALTGDDVLLCQITNQAKSDSYSIPITQSDLVSGTLRVDSNARPNRLFTADSSIVLCKAATLVPSRLRQVTDRIVQILRS